MLKQVLTLTLSSFILVAAGTQAGPKDRRDHRHQYHARHHHHHHHHHSHSHHRGSRDAERLVYFLGGTLVGAAISSHSRSHSAPATTLVHQYPTTTYVTHQTYQRGSYGECFRVEYRGGQKMLVQVPGEYCQVY